MGRFRPDSGNAPNSRMNSLSFTYTKPALFVPWFALDQQTVDRLPSTMNRYAHSRPLARQDQPGTGNRSAPSRRLPRPDHRLPDPRNPRRGYRYGSEIPHHSDPPHLKRQAGPDRWHKHRVEDDFPGS